MSTPAGSPAGQAQPSETRWRIDDNDGTGWRTGLHYDDRDRALLSLNYRRKVLPDIAVRLVKITTSYDIEDT